MVVSVHSDCVLAVLQLTLASGLALVLSLLTPVVALHYAALLLARLVVELVVVSPPC